MTEKSNGSLAARSGRSPAYPAFDLETAIEKLKVFHKANRYNAVSITGATDSLGYKSERSGTAQRAIAALISYGLLSEEGVGPARKVKITELGRKILLLPEDDEDRIGYLQEAALKPKIYRDMLDEWPESLPSDAEMTKFLTIERDYNEETVRILIRDFKATYEFARLEGNGIISEQEPDKAERKDSHVANKANPPLTDVFSSFFPPPGAGRATMTPSAPAAEARTLTIPITGGRIALLQTPGEVTENDFKFLQTYLTLMKDAIITGTVSPPPATKPFEIRTGAAIWRAQDVDRPITVIGYWGERGGTHYVRIEGSDTGVPLNEVVYDSTVSLPL